MLSLRGVGGGQDGWRSRVSIFGVYHHINGRYINHKTTCIRCRYTVVVRFYLVISTLSQADE
jgi:hypothetical protein